MLLLPVEKKILSLNKREKSDRTGEINFMQNIKLFSSPCHLELFRSVFSLIEANTLYSRFHFCAAARELCRLEIVFSLLLFCLVFS